MVLLVNWKVCKSPCNHCGLTHYRNTRIEYPLKSKLVNVLLFEWLLVNYSLKGHLGDVNNITVAMKDDIADDSSGCNALLYAMSTKPINKKQIGDDRMWA